MIYVFGSAFVRVVSPFLLYNVEPFVPLVVVFIGLLGRNNVQKVIYQVMFPSL